MYLVEALEHRGDIVEEDAGPLCGEGERGLYDASDGDEVRLWGHLLHDCLRTARAS